MSASKFFRNFLALPQMGIQKSNCNATRENEHQDDDSEIQETRATSSDDKCNSIAASDTDIYGDIDYQDLVICKEGTEEMVKDRDVNGLPVSECDGSFILNQRLYKDPPMQSVIMKPLVELVDKETYFIQEPSHRAFTTVGEVKFSPNSLVPEELRKNETKKACSEISASNGATVHPLLQIAENVEHIIEQQLVIAVSQNAVMKGSNVTSLLAEKLVAAQEGHLPFMPNDTNTALLKAPTEPARTIDRYKAQEPPVKKIRSCNNGRFDREEQQLVLRDTDEQMNRKTDVSSFQLKSLVVKLYRCSDKTQKKITPELVMSLNNGTAVQKNLSDNPGHLETNSHLLQQENSRVMKNPIVTTQSSTMLLSFENSEEADEVPHRAVNACGTTSTLSREAESLFSSDLPTGSTLCNYQGVFHTKDNAQPFVCGFSVETCDANQALHSDIALQHQEKQYSCEFCGKRYARQGHLASHVIVHRQKKFSCDKCDQRFLFKGTLRRHALTHTKDRPFSCTICHKSFKSESNLSEHCKIHKEKDCREFVICDICKKEFSDQYILKQHMKIHYGEKPFRCVLCDRDFRLELHLQQHMITHKITEKLVLGDAHNPEESTTNVPHHPVNDPDASSSCISHAESMVSSELPPGSTLVSDQGVFHIEDKEKPFVCSFCGKNYLSKQDVDAHISQNHEKWDQSYSCQFCGERFGGEYHLSRHLKTHNSINPFTCFQYGMCFQLRVELCHHKCTHAEKEPFPCKVCNMSYMSARDLVSHSKVHENKYEWSEKPHNSDPMQNNVHPFKLEPIQDLAETSIPMPNTSHGGTVSSLLKIPENVEHTMQQQLHVAVSQNAAMMGSNVNFLLAGKLVAAKKGHLPVMPNGSNTVLLNAPKEPAQTIEHCKAQEPPVKKIRSCNNSITDRERRLMLLDDQQKYKTDVSSFQLKSLELKLNRCSYKAHYEATPELVFSSNNWDDVVEEQLPNSAGHVEANSHPLQLENNQVIEKPSISMTPTRLATNNARSPLSHTNSELTTELSNLDFKLYNVSVSPTKMAIDGEPHSSSTMKIKSNQTNCKRYLTKAEYGKRISVASGIEDEGSSPESSRCSTTSQTLLSSENTEVDEEVPRHAVNGCGTTSTLSGEVESLFSSDLPTGSTLLNYQGVFRTKDTVKPFACGFCGKAFDDTLAVCSHIALQHQEKRYFCEFCGKRYAHQCHLATHIVVHTQEKLFFCDQCDLRFRFQGGLRRHMDRHTKERPFSCRICHKSFKSESNLSEHCKIHKEKDCREFVICDICKKEFSDQYILKQHMKIHYGEKPFRCVLCDRDFRLELHLQQHMITHKITEKLVLGDAHNPEESTTNVPHHPVNDPDASSSFISHAESMVSSELPPGSTLVSDQGVFHIGDEEKPFACSFCGKNYLSKKGVDAHILQNHEWDQSYSCQFCGERFGTEYHLSRHVKTREGINQFTCYQCGMRFQLEDELCHHKSMHRKTALFPCKICRKSYMSERELFIHGKVHKEEEHKERVVCVCNICKKEFGDQNMLKEHVKVHSEENPFRCTLCERGFRLETQLELHMIIHNRTWNQLLGDAHDSEDSAIISSGKVNFIQSNSKAEERTTLWPILSSKDCTALVKQLPQNTDLKQSNIHPLQLESIEDLPEPSLPIASPLSRTNNRLVGAHNKSSDDLCSKVVSESEDPIVNESRISNIMEINSYKSQGMFCSSKSVNGERYSVTTGVVYDDATSTLEGSQCAMTTHTLLPEAAKQHLSSSSRQTVDDNGDSSSFRSPVGSMVSSQPPPGAKRLYYRNVFYTKGKEKPFSCGFCGKAYKVKHSLYGHIMLKHEELRYSCEFCGKRYVHPSGLAEHVTIHRLEKPYTCDQCGKQFRLQKLLHKHHQYNHSEERSFPCKKCSKSFKSASGLSRHRITHQKYESREGFICSICNKKLSKAFSLKEHMMIHTGEKPFKCSVCDKQFRTKAQLNIHLNSHNGKKRLKPCSVCGKSVWESYMPTHIRMHSGEKPFECNMCLKKFPKKQNLEGHMRSHTGEKPFACSGCDKRFALYSNMMTHKAKCTLLSDKLP